MHFRKILISMVVTFGFTSPAKGHVGDEHEPEVHGEIEDGIWAGSRNFSMKKLTGVDLRWITTDLEYVTMEMKAKTTGYVAVGFCEHWYGTMKDCDIVLGWVAANGTAYIRDYYARSNGMPEEDPSQDYILTHAAQDEYETRIQFRRKWVTGDPMDADLKNTEVRVMYAYHPVDPTSFNDFYQHDRSTRGHTLRSESLYTTASNGFRRIILPNIIFYLMGVICSKMLQFFQS